MGTNRKCTGLALRFGLAAALLASAAVTSTSATADKLPAPGTRPAQGAVSSPESLDGGLRCTMSSGTSSTGREWATVDISSADPSICLRRRVGGEAPEDYPSCYRRAYDELGCTTVITVG